ncbi:MAG: biotin carboxylase N-terminal domain-containing protein [Myxococcota bacterium]|nr:biotin carboxylase N-terminal domain-containing protein [Myxococcota bacterium]
MFETILVANRGEIACRIIRTARRLGLKTVAVYSEADRNALHVQQAHEAVFIGDSPARESYLLTDRILAAAQKSGANAVHPGYGFLSENPEFAEACVNENLSFIGPPASAIRIMGRKDHAKRQMEAAGVPVIPGEHNQDEDLDAAAAKIGFPLLVKAVAGGGGKGMRRVDSPDSLEKALESARREALSSFGDDRLLIEKWLGQSRHIEIQVFADSHGGVVHLFERDCSLQRRHQKVIEEAPAPGMTEELRAAMGAAAVRATQAIDYCGAGTIEFLVDVSNGLDDAPFYFMEMNTRLQVEHPVTEAITGIDLVEWQIRVASGEALPLKQEEISLRGHAIEARVYAEDPSRRYLPQTGRLIRHRPPQADEHIRVDSGIGEGDSVTIHYDPMVSKLIARASNREGALRYLRNALEQYQIAGLVTNLSFLHAISLHPSFLLGEIDTNFLGDHGSTLVSATTKVDNQLIAMACGLLLAQREASAYPEVGFDPFSPWAETDGFRLNEDGFDVFRFNRDKTDLDVVVHFTLEAQTLEWGDQAVTLRDIELNENRISAIIDGTRVEGFYAREEDNIWVMRNASTMKLGIRRRKNLTGSGSTSDGNVRSVMPGKVTAILVESGESVEQGQPLLTLEAMKMEHTLVSPRKGVVGSFEIQVGQQVMEQDLLIRIEPLPHD